MEKVSYKMVLNDEPLMNNSSGGHESTIILLSDFPYASLPFASSRFLNKCASYFSKNFQSSSINCSIRASCSWFTTGSFRFLLRRCSTCTPFDNLPLRDSFLFVVHTILWRGLHDSMLFWLVAVAVPDLELPFFWESAAEACSLARPEVALTIALVYVRHNIVSFIYLQKGGWGSSWRPPFEIDHLLLSWL